MSIAFFDIDGTLLAKPSLERRFFWHLRRRGKIPAANYLRWTVNAARFGVHDLRAAVQANKSYLRSLAANIFLETEFQERTAWFQEFFPAALQRVWWHALRGDSIVLVSGTLAPLAEIVKLALERELRWRGVESKILVIATQLEVHDGYCTGQISGAAMFGRAKAAATKDLARAQGISLEKCSAYGDSSLDRWMLASVGHPCAVNSTRRLARVARLRHWPMRLWTHGALRTGSDGKALKGSLEWTV